MTSESLQLGNPPFAGIHRGWTRAKELSPPNWHNPGLVQVNLSRPEAAALQSQDLEAGQQLLTTEVQEHQDPREEDLGPHQEQKECGAGQIDLAAEPTHLFMPQ